MKVKDSIDARKIQLVQRVLAINDPGKLEAMEHAIGSDGYSRFTKEDMEELELIRDGMADGSIQGRPWGEVKKDLLRRFK